MFSVKRIREDLAILDIPDQHAKIIPGYGWIPPSAGSLKINIDGALNLDDFKAGVGGVVRSSLSLLRVWSKPHQGVSDPFMAKSLALREGMLFTKL